MLGSRNKRLVGEGLQELSLRLGFRAVDGFAERVIFREFYPRGLTALDNLDEGTLGTRPSMSHVTARQEVETLLQVAQAADRRARHAPRRGPAGVVCGPGPAAGTARHHRAVDARQASALSRRAGGALRRAREGAFIGRRWRKTALPLRPKAAKQPAAASPRAEIDAFLNKVKSLGPAAQSGQRGRLIFALDATMSRQPMWDTACRLQGDMFNETAAIGGLDVQLLYYRGLAECRASRWVSDARRLGGLMEKIDCRGGHTQIGKILAHARRENEAKKVQALVFVGDAMEEPIDDLCAAAGQLGLLGVPAFVFQEGGDAVAEQAFREIARLSRGAYCRFDISAAHELAELLRAVAAYAAGGMKALADLKARHNSGAVKLLAQLR